MSQALPGKPETLVGFVGHLVAALQSFLPGSLPFHRVVTANS